MSQEEAAGAAAADTIMVKNWDFLWVITGFKKISEKTIKSNSTRDVEYCTVPHIGLQS